MLSEKPAESDDDYSEPTYVGNNNTKVPANIRESMLSQPIDVSSLGSVSVLDSMGLTPSKMPKQKTAPKIVNEQSIRQQPIVQSPSVDYTIIKAIVNECLKEYFEKMEDTEFIFFCSPEKFSDTRLKCKTENIEIIKNHCRYGE